MLLIEGFTVLITVLSRRTLLDCFLNLRGHSG